MLSICQLIFLALTSCQHQEQELDFTTLSQKEVINYQIDIPALIVIAQPEEIEPSEASVFSEDPELSKQLHGLDYTDVFAVLALQGQKQITGYSITVQRVIQKDSQVTILAETTEPSQDTRIKPALTSPYHLIVVSKSESLSGNISFSLEVSGTTVAKTEHFLP
jgi:hypothetical protein